MSATDMPPGSGFADLLDKGDTLLADHSVPAVQRLAAEPFSPRQLPPRAQAGQGARVNAAKARENLDAAVREQLREAWERGLAAGTRGPGALADAGAPAGFSKVSRAADDYAAAVAGTWRRP